MPGRQAGSPIEPVAFARAVFKCTPEACDDLVCLDCEDMWEKVTIDAVDRNFDLMYALLQCWPGRSPKVRLVREAMRELMM
eukprot:11890231-Alexandrium_andersonii.AAC.1